MNTQPTQTTPPHYHPHPTPISRRQQLADVTDWELVYSFKCDELQDGAVHGKAWASFYSPRFVGENLTRG